MTTKPSPGLVTELARHAPDVSGEGTAFAAALLDAIGGDDGINDAETWLQRGNRHVRELTGGKTAAEIIAEEAAGGE